MTKAFAQGLAEHNIRVNCVAPGVIQTDFSRLVSVYSKDVICV